MSRLIALGFLGTLLLSGCYIEANDNGDGVFDDEDSDCAPGHGTGGKKSTAATGGTGGATGGAGGATGVGACKAHADCGAGKYCLLGSGQCTQASSCAKEADCISGFNCDAASKTCMPAAAETCGELGDEAACVDRGDCAPNYAGVDCSCGTDCKCVGGEPGCVCTSFEFFRCEEVVL